MHFVKAKTLLSASNGMNIYRGCQHGCIYCDSRSDCYRMTHEFEDIEVKENALLLLEEVLRRKHKKCVIATGSMSDPYIPLERDLLYTRRALELIDRYGFGLAILTKSDLILRDIDVLASINKKAACVVQMTLTTADERLSRIVEPGVCTSARRFEVLCKMNEAGIDTAVWFGPILPFINDTEDNILRLMDYCVRAHVKALVFFGIGMTLREGNREYYYAQLDRHFPGLSSKYRQRYGNAYQIASDRSARLSQIVRTICRENGIMCDPAAVFSWLRTFEDRTFEIQRPLFE